MTPASDRQQDFIADLLRQTGVPLSEVGRARTADEARSVIDWLLDVRDGQAPLRENTRKAVFATLRRTSHTKADMYAGVGIGTMSDGASERDGQRCLRWLSGEMVDVLRPMPAAPTLKAADLLRLHMAPGRHLVTT